MKKKLKIEKLAKKEKHLAAKLLQGFEYHRKGLLNQAELIYKEIIDKTPHNFDALQLLGALYLQNNQCEKALETFSNALLINKLNANLYYNIGMTSHRLNLLENALENYEKAIALEPDLFDAYTNRGNVLIDQGLIDEAIASYEIAISINKYDVKAYSNRGAALKIKGNFKEALESLEKAISIKSDHAEAHCNRADVLKELMRYEEAIEGYNQAIKIKPSYIDAICNKGLCLTEMRKFEDALDCYKKAIEINVRFEKAWCNKGVVFNLLNKYEDALNCFEKAISLNRGYAEAWSNKGLALLGLKRYDESIHCSRKAIDLKENLAEPHLHLAQAYLSKSCFSEGWKEYEWRWNIKYIEKYKLDYKQSIWKGDKKNNTLYVWPEQGIGDQILYSSVLQELENYPQNKIVALDKKLIPIYERTYRKIKFIERNSNIEDLRFDEHIAIGSLMQYFRKSIEDFNKTKFPYLIDDLEKTNNLKSKINYNNKIICGISWRSENPLYGEYKSIKLKDLSKIIMEDKLYILNLQYKSGKIENNIDKEYLKYINEINGLDIYNDIDALASAIQLCNIVITCSNTTAHLAGALNKTTLLLLPSAAGRFWYWNEVNQKSIWYPSVRIFQQKTTSDWSDTINEINEYINKHYKI